MLAAGVAGLAATALAVILAAGSSHGPAASPAPAAPASAVPDPAARTAVPEPGARTVALAPTLAGAVRDAGPLATAVTPATPPSPAGAEPARDAVPAVRRPKISPGAPGGPRPGRPVQPAPAAAPAPGTVKISATPWARVTVAGSDASCNETPCVLQLPAGKHTLRLVNPVAGLSKERHVELAPGETVVIRETLGP